MKLSLHARALLSTFLPGIKPFWVGIQLHPVWFNGVHGLWFPVYAGVALARRYVWYGPG